MPDLRQLLGRIAKPDPRDFPLKLRLAEVPFPSSPLKRRYWNDNGWWGDQSLTPPSESGDHPYCVDFATNHLLADGPICQPCPQPGAPPFGDLLIYREAQKRDEWPGEGYDGTSGRGALEFLREIGLVKAYHRAQNASELAEAIMRLGPALCGTDWYEAMFEPDVFGNLKIEGTIVGGHEWVCNGYSRVSRHFRCKNSWGRAWGSRGRFYLTFDQMEKLLAEGGDAYIVEEQKKAA